MKPPEAAFHGTVPQNYDQYLGPTLFEPYAADLAARVDPTKVRDVLEIACGTGVLTQVLRQRLPSSVRLVASDLNRAMIDFAVKKLPGDIQVEWQEADASALPFPDQSFDAVLAQFGLMFVPDKDKANREAYRVLRPGSVYLFNVWDSLEQNDVSRIAHETAVSFFKTDPPMFLKATPFGYFDRDAIRRSVEQAGFSEVKCEPVQLPSRSPSAADYAAGLIRGTPLSVGIQDRGGNLDEITAATAEAIRKAYGDGPVEAKMQALVWRAKRP